ncbi:MAG: methionyl-tRNA formyltransferase [Kiritimatiellia bacterium]
MTAERTRSHSPLRTVFMGSAQLACPSLERLVADRENELVAVVTQPDRPGGRHLKIRACPVKALAEQRGLNVLAPEKVNAKTVIASLCDLQPDLIVVVAYGQMLGRELLSIPVLGCINLHPSLLPAYRGAAPVQWAIARGEQVTGVTTMLLNERMDAGDIIFQRAVAIDAEDTAGSLERKLALAGAELLAETVAAIRDGKAPRQRQDEAKASYAPRLRKEDGRIDWKLPAEDIHNRVRAFNPWPGCFCRVRATTSERGGILRVWKTRVEKYSVGGASLQSRFDPGQIVELAGDGPVVATGSDLLRLLEVQPEGKRVMSGKSFLCGRRLAVGIRLE